MKKTTLILFLLALPLLLAAGRTDEHRDTRRNRPSVTPVPTSTASPLPPVATNMPADVCHTCPSYEPTPLDGPTPIVGVPCDEAGHVNEQGPFFCTATPSPLPPVTGTPIAYPPATSPPAYP